MLEHEHRSWSCTALTAWGQKVCIDSGRLYQQIQPTNSGHIWGTTRTHFLHLQQQSSLLVVSEDQLATLCEAARSE
jgi:hypothetical protein